METPKKGFDPVSWGFTVAFLIFMAILIVNGLRSGTRNSNEREASAALKTLASAQADFRGNDRDGNMIQDFWTEDVAGLYFRVPAGATDPLRLIALDVARADPAQPGAKPYSGYWLTAMDKDESGNPYRTGSTSAGQASFNPSKFGFCAYPAEYGKTGTFTFIINEGHTIFKEDLKGKPRLRWPQDSELRFHYSKDDE